MADQTDPYGKPAQPISPVFNLIDPSVKGGRRYNETRDIAHFYPHMMRAVVEGISNFQSDVPMLQYMQATGVTPDDLLQVILKYGDYIRSVVSHEAKFSSPHDTAVRTGLEQTNPLARYLLMARIGIAVTALFHDAYMDAFVSGVRPTLTEFEVKDLIDRAFKAHKERERIVLTTAEAAG